MQIISRNWNINKTLAIIVTTVLSLGLIYYLSQNRAQGETRIHQRIDTFSANGTWTAPAGILDGTVRVETWGAGGGGTAGTGGGGGGAYAREPSVAVSTGQQWTVVVGLGAEGVDGGDSSFALNFATSTLAKGGLSGANGGTGGTAGASTGSTKFSGANGGTGSETTAGGGGAGDGANGSSSNGGAVNGGYSSTNRNGANFGGGGGSSSVNSLSGGDGRVRITYSQEASSGYAYINSRSFNRQITNTTGTHTVTMPSGIAAGDLLLVVFTNDGDALARASTTAEGWSVLGTDVNGTVVRQTIFWKVAAGSDTLTATTSASEMSSSIILLVKDGGTPTASRANGDSTNADPPSHDAGSSAKYLWIATGGWDVSGTAFLKSGSTATPANYIDHLYQPASSVLEGTGTAVSNRNVETQTENPGVWTSATEQWVAFTIAVPFNGTEESPLPSTAKTVIKGGTTIKGGTRFR